MEEITTPKKKISLYKALKAGYTRDIDKQQKVFKKYGFIVDRDLTDEREHVVAYNPERKKLLYISQGTDPSSVKDIKTDLALAAGMLKDTPRYKEEKAAFDAARAKYGVEGKDIVLAGHSLSGNIVNYLAPSGSEAYTYNAAFTPGQKVRENVHNYKTSGDIFSTFAPSATTTVMPNTRAVEFGDRTDIGRTHELENAKNYGIFF